MNRSLFVSPDSHFRLNLDYYVLQRTFLCLSSLNSHHLLHLHTNAQSCAFRALRSCVRFELLQFASMQVLQAVVDWLRYDARARTASLARVLGAVRMPHVDK